MTAALLFGKLPTHGDFLARGLSPGERHGWDDSISISLSDAERALGPRFLEAYGAAAPWRCALALESGWIGGALAPSVDSAGRLFPILLARRSASGAAANAMAAACEALLFDAIAEHWTADALFAEAEALDDPEQASPGGQEGWWLAGGELLAPPTPILDDILPAALLTEMLQVTERLA